MLKRGAGEAKKKREEERARCKYQTHQRSRDATHVLKLLWGDSSWLLGVVRKFGELRGAVVELEETKVKVERRREGWWWLGICDWIQ
jgi:hypothetical protein